MEFLYLLKQSCAALASSYYTRCAEYSDLALQIYVRHCLLRPLLSLIFHTGIFPSAFIDFLFDLVEQTRDMQNDAFNYSIIKLIVRCVHFIASFILTSGRSP